MNLGGWQNNFKITLGTCVFKKSCSTSNLAGVDALFDKFYAFFCSKSGACQLASLPRQTKPPYLASQANLASHANLATQANQAGQRNEAKRLSKPSKPIKPCKTSKPISNPSKSSRNKHASKVAKCAELA